MNHMRRFFSVENDEKKNPKHGESYVLSQFLLPSNKKKWQSFHIQTILGISVAEQKFMSEKVNRRNRREKKKPQKRTHTHRKKIGVAIRSVDAIKGFNHFCEFRMRNIIQVFIFNHLRHLLLYYHKKKPNR